MSSRKSIYFLLPILLFCMATVQAQDKSALHRILESGTLRVGTTGTQPPFCLRTPNGELIGYEIDLARLLAKNMNVALKLVEKPFAELLPALERGEVDAVMSGMTITAARNLTAAFAGPYMVSGKSILAKATRIEALDELSEIKASDVVVVCLLGSTSQTFVEENLPDVKLETTTSYAGAVQMVLDDEADVMVADYPICAVSIFRYPEADLGTLNKPITVEPIGMALPANDFQLHNTVQNFLNALEVKGVLDELDERWFQDGKWLSRME